MRVGIIGENSNKWIELLLKTWHDNNCLVIIDWRNPIKTIRQMLRETNVEICYIDNNIGINLKQFQDLGISFIYYKSSNEMFEIIDDNLRRSYIEKNDLSEAVIIYSSGTTKERKGIILTHKAINENLNSINKSLNLISKGNILSVRSLNHSSALVGELLLSLKFGYNLIISKTIKHPKNIINAVLKYDIEYLFLNPTLLKMLSENIKKTNIAMSSLKRIYSSGAVITTNQIEEAKSILQIPVLNMYGLTEAGPRVSIQTIEYCTDNSAGKVIENVQVKVINNEGEELGPYSKGTVLVKTPSIFKGYVNDENKYYGKWFDTKDIGYFNDKNELFITGRKNEMIIKSGHNINPFDIEYVLNLIEEIEECVVFSLPDKNNIEGEIIACEYVSNKELDRRQLLNHCRMYLKNYEIPDKLMKVKEIPKNTNGKISRSRIKSKYIDAG